jgi:hypothetical protein
METPNWLRKKDPILPKNLDHAEQQVVDIFQELLINPKTELHYDPEKYECFLECEPYFMVMEAGKVIIVNSIYSHEVRLSLKTEAYISFNFNKEVSKRRQALKLKYLSKVEKNLGKILESLKKLS